jgi:hypothetical protein
MDAAPVTHFRVIHKIYAEAMPVMKWFYALNQMLDMPLCYLN